MKPECPYLKQRDGQQEGQRDFCEGPHNKVSKVMGPKSGTPQKKGESGRNQGGDHSGSTTSSSSRSSQSSTGSTLTSTISQGGGISKGVEEIKPNQSTTLVTDINGLVKSLQSIKAVRLCCVARTMADSGEGPVALIDEGATHGPRTGTAEELNGAKRCGRAGAWQYYVVQEARMQHVARQGPGRAHRPMRQLIEAGYKVKWTAKDLTISHPVRGPIRCWRRQGCPVVERQDGLLLLQSLEEEAAQVGDQVQEWW